ncbi:MAG: EAL domain-containing protein [Hyphomicrobiaceae bacterium]|nr:EAL domain-containing protein [Hyphomicrobiaceae bacterium]
MKHWRSHAFALAVLVAAALTGLAGTFQNTLVDLRFASAKKQPTGNVAVAAIDARALEMVGVWPWQRQTHAEILAKIQSLGVADVAFDIDFSSRATPDDDKRFAEQLKAFGGSAILPAFKQAVRNTSGALEYLATRPRKEFAEHAWLASVNVTPEKDGRVRRYESETLIDQELHPSLAVMLAGRPDVRTGSFGIDYSIDARKIPVVSISDLLAGRVSRKALEGKKLIVGATAIELGDRFAVPVYGILPGVVVQALATETLLQSRALVGTSVPVTIAGLLLIAVIGHAVRQKRLSAGSSAAIFLPLALVVEGGAHLVQAYAAIAVDSSLWLIAIGVYFSDSVLSDLDVRRLLASIAQRRFQSIAVSLGDGIICTDAVGRVTFWNPAAEKMFDAKADTALGKPFADFLGAAGARYIKAMLAGQAPATVLEVTGMQNGSELPLEIRASTWEAEDGRHHSFIVRDVTDRRRSEERMRFLAHHDLLTGLPNRNRLRELLRDRIEANPASAGFAVLLLGLDNFKEVNDRLGHDGGDFLLSDFARQLSSLFPGSDTVARIGGDEFAVVIDLEDNAVDTAAASIRNILGDGERYTYIDGQGFQVSASIGTARYPRDGSNIDDLLTHADLALFRAKADGRGLHVAYEPSLKEATERRRALEASLRQAFERREFELFYQPQVRLTDGKLVGAEALIRWRKEDGRIAPPGEFLDVLSHSRLAASVGTWILHAACEQAAAWHKAGHDICVGVNLFAPQFAPTLVGELSDTLMGTGLPANLLEIEITENILLSDDERTIELLGRIRSLGVRIALDDFGTGFASLTHLKKFPLDRLKIDRSFVTALGTDQRDTAIVGAMITLGKQLDIDTIAEGIEDAECAELLRIAGCGEAQGYFFGKPMPAEEFEERLMSLPARTTRAA